MSLNFLNSTLPFSTQAPKNSSEHAPHEVKSFAKSIGILFIPFSLIAFFCVLSGIIYYVMKKRKLDQLRHHLVPMYSFDPGEGDDWEAEVLEAGFDGKPGKRLNDYKTMESGAVTSPRL